MKKAVHGVISVYRVEVGPSECTVIDELEFVVKKKVVRSIKNTVVEACAEALAGQASGNKGRNEPFCRVCFGLEDGSVIDAPLGTEKAALQRWERIKVAIERNMLKRVSVQL